MKNISFKIIKIKNYCIKYDFIVTFRPIINCKVEWQKFFMILRWELFFEPPNFILLKKLAPENHQNFAFFYNLYIYSYYRCKNNLPK